MKMGWISRQNRERIERLHIEALQKRWLKEGGKFCDHCGCPVILEAGHYQHLYGSHIAADGHPAEYLTEEERELRESFAERTVEGLIR